ncbi:uncharacterized protein TRIADDRAFT_61619 [Trichoplax adhaerens]|uniref:N-acetyltransferase domain-containing protein n=1 Tax=Trichoplax adhaerens TaxID=10228 RepID=B3SBH5_TRIAD|nr:hypothetical protein TRIADDRAFT_61619 [Trichoplax adhaerens]EDV19957.1 hypothetical protein TRIADDRAFT_61619 [Trichoplax adhaerens]|eukprot:XP_002117547.1 hypothetical protein TRIADDRAFT_61619 [Trichoplax adhaerens]
MADSESWNPGCKDATTFHQADPTGFFIGLLNDQPIACISAVKYEEFAFIGYYIVEKEYRGKGYGLKLFQHAMNTVKDYKKIGLDAVLQQVSNYQKFGFQTVHRNMRYIGPIGKLESPCDNIVEAKSVAFDKMVEYDRHFSPGLRKYFLASLMNTGTDRSLVYLDNDKAIQGYGTIRKAVLGYRIGPLYAENTDIAETLIRALVETFQDCKILLDVPMENEMGIKLVEKLQLEAIFETVRMYTDGTYAYDVNKVFAVTCLELG